MTLALPLAVLLAAAPPAVRADSPRVEPATASAASADASAASADASAASADAHASAASAASDASAASAEAVADAPRVEPAPAAAVLPVATSAPATLPAAEATQADALAAAGRPPPTAAQRVAVGATATGASLVALAAGVSTGALVPHFAFQASGRHSPAAWAGGYLLAGAATALAMTFLPPLAVLLADTPEAAAAARTGAFRYTRWALAAAGAGFVSFCVGAGLEGGGFGRGQWAMLGGLALGVLSGLAAAVLEAVGVLQSWPAERQP